MMIGRRAVLAGLPLMLAGCAGQAVWAPEESVAAVRHRHPGPPQITLVTCLNNDSRSGAHTGLILNASERVIFDPAGSFRFDGMAERNDVVFGATDAVVARYAAFQASEAYHAILLTKPVSPEVAEAALRGVLAAGPVPKVQCTRVTANVLRALPGFEGLRTTWLPDNLMRQFARLPEVTSEFVYLDQDKWLDANRLAYEEEVLAHAPERAQVSALPA